MALIQTPKLGILRELYEVGVSVEVDPWSEKIRSSPISGLVKSITSASESRQQLIDSDPAAGYILNRAQSVSVYAEKRLHASNPMLVPRPALAEMERLLSQINSEITQFAADGNTGHLNNVDQWLDPLLSQVNELPPGNRRLPDSEAPRAFMESLGQLESRLARAESTLDAALNQREQTFEERMNSLLAGADSQFQALRVAIDELGVTGRATQDQVTSTSDRFVSEIAAEKTRLDQLIGTTTTELAALKTTSSDQLRSGLEGFDTSAKKRLEELEADWMRKFESLERRLQEELDFFKEKEISAKQILGVVAASATAEAYLNEAKRQGTRATIWQAGGIFAGLLAVGVALWMAHEITASVSELSGGSLAAATSARLAVVGAAGGLAVWVNAQMAHHRRREHEAQTIGDELTSLRPFIAELDDSTQRSEIKEAFSRYFPGKRSVIPVQDSDG